MGDLRDREHRHLWHPFTQMGDWLDSEPLTIERGEGNYLIDTEGNRYLDGISSMWVNMHGHDHPTTTGEAWTPVTAGGRRIVTSARSAVAAPFPRRKSRAAK